MKTEKSISYREFLLREFSYRKRRNENYSLRAFARDLEVPAPKLSEALNGKCGFSAKRAMQIADKLNLSIDEKNLFVSLVEKEHSRSSVGKAQAHKKVELLLTDGNFKELDLERFKIISDWYHFAILELADIASFQSNATWISKRLKISKKEAQTAIERLLDFGLLAQNASGNWFQTQADLATPNGIPSREIREQHSQLMNIALHSLDNDPIAERDFSAITLAFNQSEMDKARTLIREFRRKFNREMGALAHKDRVYCIALQFFPLDDKNV